MKQLMIMRHAKSSWKNADLSDHDRPLNPRGLDSAPRMGQFADEQNCLPELVLSSTANRAISTARLFVEACHVDIPVLTQKSLYHPSIDDYRSALYSLTANQSRIMVVSHNPGSEDWIYDLTGARETMPTAAIAVVDFDDDFRWTSLMTDKNTSGQLVAVWRPREVL